MSLDIALTPTKWVTLLWLCCSPAPEHANFNIISVRKAIDFVWLDAGQNIMRLPFVADGMPSTKIVRRAPRLCGGITLDPIVSPRRPVELADAGRFAEHCNAN